MGRASLLCPGISDVNLFCYCQGVIALNAEITVPTLLLGRVEGANWFAGYYSYCRSTVRT